MDRRACLVTLTEGGRDFCQRLMATRRRAIADALREWSPERVRAFTEMFREFNRAVEAHQATPPSAMPGSRSTASPPAGVAETTALAARV